MLLLHEQRAPGMEIHAMCLDSNTLIIFTYQSIGQTMQYELF